jgi:hypothetical protein
MAICESSSPSELQLSLLTLVLGLKLSPLF